MKPAEPLHTCPKCGRKNFTTRGLKAHVCRPDRNPSPMAKTSPTSTVSSKTAALAVLSEPQQLVPVAQLQDAALRAAAEIGSSQRNTALRAILLGLTLHRVKASLKYGEFTGWLLQKLPMVTSWSPATAKKNASFYMRLATVAVEKSKATRPELLALPGDQAQLTLDTCEGEAKQFMEKLSKFVGEQSLDELLRKHEIRTTAKLGGAHEQDGDGTDAVDTTPPTPEELATRAKTELSDWLDHGRQLLITDNVCSSMQPADIKAFDHALGETLAHWRRGVSAIVVANKES